MRKYVAELGSDEYWSPRIGTLCPHCEAMIKFYTKIFENECTICRQKIEVPFGTNLGRIAKDVKERKMYHVNSS